MRSREGSSALSDQNPGIPTQIPKGLWVVMGALMGPPEHLQWGGESAHTHTPQPGTVCSPQGACLSCSAGPGQSQVPLPRKRDMEDGCKILCNFQGSLDLLWPREQLQM